MMLCSTGTQRCRDHRNREPTRPNDASGCAASSFALNGTVWARFRKQRDVRPLTRCSSRQCARSDTPRESLPPPPPPRRDFAGSSAPSQITPQASRETGASARRQPPTPPQPHAHGFFLAEATPILCAHGSFKASSKQPIPLRPRLGTRQSAPTPAPPNKRNHTTPHHPTAFRLGGSSALALAAGAGGSAKRGASGGLERRQHAYEREMLLMAAPGASAEHQKRRRGRPLSADLLQNCDLPPPAKLFGPLPTLQRLESAAGTDQNQKGNDGGNDSLLRALRLSQSRAREAEEKLAAAGASNGGLAALLVRDSVALSAHRRWVMMLEAENSVLRGGKGGGAAGAEPGEDEDGGAVVAAAWWVALAVCVGIAGVGLALGNLLL